MSGQAEKGKTGKTREQGQGRQRSLIQSSGARGKTLVGMNEQNKLATDGEHRYKYTGDNGEDGLHLEGGWRQTQRQVKQIRV